MKTGGKTSVIASIFYFFFQGRPLSHSVTIFIVCALCISTYEMFLQRAGTIKIKPDVLVLCKKQAS